MLSVVKARPAFAYAVWEDEQGEATDPGESLTVTFEDDRGNVLGANVPAETGPDGVAKVAVPAEAVAEIGRLSIVWTGGPYPLTTELEVAGAGYVTLGQLRARKNLGDPRFADWQLRTALSVAESTVESFCGVSFVPRYEREKVDGANDRCLLVSRPYVTRALWATVGGEDVDVDGWEPLPGAAFYTNLYAAPAGVRNVELGYEHGYPSAPPDVAHAVASIVEELLVGALDGLPDRATALTTDGVTYAIAQAGPNRPTGIPSVDATLVRRREPEVPAI